MATTTKPIHIGVCEGCGNTYKNARSYNDRIRNDNERSIYYKLKYLTRKLLPTEYCNTLRGSEKDLDNHLKYRCHLNENGKRTELSSVI